jgi:lipoyl synthase
MSTPRRYNAKMRISLADRILNPSVAPRQFTRRGKPRWLRMQLPHSRKYGDLLRLVADHNLHTVCQEAACPNMGECWSNGVATVMILGDTCTRSCGFCHIRTGRPPTLDLDEPRRVADAIRIMDLSYVVITSVNRDELPDGGAGVWAATIRETRRAAPHTKIEVLIPDFCGDWAALQAVLDARPDVLAHNMETVRRLYPVVRPQAKYSRSIELLRRAKEQGFVVKTGFMVGIGERDEEVIELIGDVIGGTKVPGAGHCDTMSIGQYLQPSPQHLPVARFVEPQMFAHYKRIGEAMGVTHIEAGPMVRSSYHADRQAAAACAAVVASPS